MIYDIQDKIAQEEWAREIEGSVGRLDGRILVLEAQIEQLKNQTTNLQQPPNSERCVSSSLLHPEAVSPKTEDTLPHAAIG
jgi:hypothetical protein